MNKKATENAFREGFRAGQADEAWQEFVASCSDL